MKYIRTNDGINKVGITKRLTSEQELAILQQLNPDWQVADTIEELCDEFVAEELFVETNYIAHINKSVSVEKKLDYFVNYFIESNKVTKDKLLNVYGAIWTDKGLIYVAKMNDKGELELI